MRCVSLFIENNYNYLLNLSNRAVGIDFGGDLLNDLTLAYLEDDEKYEPLCIRGELMKYICRSIAICGFSKSTRFYYKYKKHNEKVARRYPIEILSAQVDIDSTITQQDLENQMDDAFSILKEIRWFDAEVKSLSDATGIPKNTLYKSIQTAKDHLKENSERIR